MLDTPICDIGGCTNPADMYYLGKRASTAAYLCPQHARGIAASPAPTFAAFAREPGGVVYERRGEDVYVNYGGSRRYYCRWRNWSRSKAARRISGELGARTYVEPLYDALEVA